MHSSHGWSVRRWVGHGSTYSAASSCASALISVVHNLPVELQFELEIFTTNVEGKIEYAENGGFDYRNVRHEL